MKAVLLIQKGLQNGTLIWRNPYLYPVEHLDEGVEALNRDGILTEYLESKTGLTFNSNLSGDELHHKIAVAFRWMDITYFDDENKVSFDAVFDNAIVAMPLSRLQIERPIITDHICLFPAGEFLVHNPCY